MIVCLMVAACVPTPTTVAVVETQPVPDFVLGLHANVNPDAYPPFAERTVCIWLNEGVLWRPGDKGLSETISSTVVTLDGQALETDLSSNSLGTVNFVYDDGGNMAGWWGDSTLCYGVDQATIGIHDMRFEITDSEGGMHRHAWQIEVK